MQMVGLFVPVYLFTRATDFPIASFIRPWVSDPLILGLATVCAFFFLVRLQVFLTAIPFGRVIQKIGLVKSMMIGNLGLIGLHLGLLFAPQYPVMLLVAAISAGIEIIFYWTSYLTEFSAYADENALPKEVSFLDLMDRIVRASLPVLGGTLIVLFGFEGLYLIATVMIVLSCVILLASSEIHLKATPSLAEFRRWLQHPEYRKIGIGLAGRFWEDNGLALWPIYLFLFLGSVERVGYLYTIALLGSLVISYFAGTLLDHRREKKSLVFSGAILSMVWVARMTAGQIWHFISVDVVQRLADSVYVPAFDLFLFRFSRHQKMFEFFVYREMLISFASLLFWLLTMMLFFVGIAWKGVFVLASLGVLSSLLLTVSTMRSHEFSLRSER